MSAILTLREGFPQATYDRCAKHAAFQLHLGAPVLHATDTSAGVELETPRGVVTADFVIAATGIDVDLARRPGTCKVRPQHRVVE